jgi:hypothetical protein
MFVLRWLFLLYNDKTFFKSLLSTVQGNANMSEARNRVAKRGKDIFE